MSETPDFVRLVIDKTRRIKLRFRHAQIRKAVTAAGNRPIGELVGDAFAGWPILLAEGHRPYNPQVTIDDASEWMDEWVRTPDPETGEIRTMDELGKLLIDALKASNFIAIKPQLKDTEEPAEGNA
jgi:hypothetical protein